MAPDNACLLLDPVGVTRGAAADGCAAVKSEANYPEVEFLFKKHAAAKKDAAAKGIQKDAAAKKDPVGDDGAAAHGYTTVKFKTEKYKEVEFWFKKDAAAKGIQMLCASRLETPDPYGGHAIRTFPEVVRTDKDRAVLRLRTPHRDFYTDYFVYRFVDVADKKGPSIVRLPQIDPEIYCASSVGLLCAADGSDRYVVANLRLELNRRYRKMEAHVDRYLPCCWKKDMWLSQEVSLDFPKDKEEEYMCKWETDLVFSLDLEEEEEEASRSLLWVDLWCGVLCCSKILPRLPTGPDYEPPAPEFKFVPLPSDLIPADDAGHWSERPASFRSAGCCNGKLKLVNLLQHSPDHSSPVIQIWALDMDEFKWIKEPYFQFSDLWATVEDKIKSPDLWKDAQPCFPVLRTDDSHTLHLMLARQNKALLLQVDTDGPRAEHVTEYSRFCDHWNPPHPLHVCSEGITSWMNYELKKLYRLLEKKKPLYPENSDKDAIIAMGWWDDASELRYDLEDAIGNGSLTGWASSHDDDKMSLELIQSAKKVQRKGEKLPKLKENNVVKYPRDGQSDPTCVVGMDDMKKKMIHELLDFVSADKVISIVGLAGSGKTTLAKQVFYHEIVATKFDCKAFVSFGPIYKMEEILISLLKQFGWNTDQLQKHKEDDLWRHIQDCVEGKRFLVVADDVWDKKAWMIIEDLLLHNNSSSKIIMTTRINDMTSRGRDYPISPLSKTDAKSLLQKEVFGSEKYPAELEDPVLEDLLDEILEDCGGLPLAIIAISDVLKNKKSEAHWKELYTLKEKSEHHWKKVYNSLRRADAEEDSIKRMRWTLSIGYHQLPYHVRMCLLCLSIYPAGHEIKRKRLVRTWIAQGLVQTQHQNVGEVGEEYFDVLINHNWIQSVDIKYDGQPRACRVHNAILDFLVYKSVEENFVTFRDYPETKKPKKKIHNLSIQNMDDVPELGEGSQSSHVRSLAIFGRFEQLPCPLKSDTLRVLDLEDCKLKADGSGDGDETTIVDASSLVHLRYLCVREPRINGLRDDQIGKMQHLETLDLRESSEGIEQQLDVTGIRQVLVGAKTTLKIETGKTTELEEVKYISVSRHSEEFLKELGKLPTLRVLGIHLDAEETSDAKKKAFALLSSLHKRPESKLRSLYIDGSWDISLNLSSGSDSGQPTTLPSVWKLKIRKWCYFREVPTWMAELGNLKKLRLGVSQLKQEKLAILGALPFLVDLFLDVLEVQGEEIFFEERTGFQNLKCLGISCRARMKVTFQEKSVPCLEHLKLHIDVRGGVISAGDKIVLGIEHLSYLTIFDALIYCIKKTDSVVKYVKDAMQKEAGDRIAIEFTEKPMRSYTDEGELVSQVCEKFENLKQDRKQNLDRAQIDIEKLQGLLQDTRSFMMMLLDDENPKYQVKEWMNTVREFCYDMQDAINILSVDWPDYASSAERNLLEQIKLKTIEEMERLLPYRKYKIHEPETLNESEDDKTSGSSSDCKAIERQVADLQREDDTLVGAAVDAQKDEIIRLLTEDGDGSSSSAQARSRKVISIVGFGGVGKTALAKQVFHRIRSKFDCAAFVAVSQKLSLSELFKEILSQFTGERKKKGATEEKSRDEWEENLKKYIQHKRYFVVLDDIWKEDHWKKIEGVLSANSSASCIIITTRIRSVARFCVQNDDYLHEVEPLNYRDSRSLFLQRIFDSEKCPSDLEEACNGILKKCGGSPLAILAVSSSLKNSRSLSRWEEVRKTMDHGISKEPSAEAMKNALSLSYYDLPYPIRMCLLYLSIFPEDYEINRKRLVNRWIAEGLIDPSPGETKSLAGERYFNVLINKCLIQPVNMRYDGKAQACRIHDTILDFIVSKSIEQNFVTFPGAQGKISDNKIRHLSMQNIEAVDLTKLEGRDLSHVRSVTVFGPVEKIPHGLKFPLLRVLDLEDCYISYQRNGGSEGYSIRDDKELFLVEYLNLRPIGTKGLPEKIGDYLLRLRTLDLSETDVEKLPVTITQLRCLVRLLVMPGTKLPDGIGQMQALEELRDVDFGEHSVDFLNELGQLSKLRILGIAFNSVGMDKVVALLSALGTLGRSCNLHSLYMEVYDPELFPLYWRHFELRWKEAVQFLREFRMTFGYIRKLPIWIGELDKLEKLRLGVDRMSETDLHQLGSLQGLLDLFLDLTCWFPQENLVFSSNGFQALKWFGIKYSIEGMTTLKFESGFMPNVKYLRLELEARYSAMRRSQGLDFGIQHLSSLRMVDVKIWCHRRTDEVVTHIKAAIQNAVDDHCNRPTLEFVIYPLRD